MATSITSSQEKPLRPDMEEWDEFLQGRYKEGKSEEEFRQYDEKADPGVARFYRLNHENQTVDYVLAKEKEYFPLQKGKKSIWEAAEFLNTLVDDSDPDTDLTQIEHLLQTSEAIRADGHPRWFVLAGFVHDLGKVLCLWGEPQWGVVGDTFPVGCAFSEHIVFPEYFANNPDLHHPVYSTKYGIYKPNCGLDKCAHVLRSRRLYIRGNEKLSAQRGSLHVALSLLLSGAQTWSVPASHE